MKWKICMCLSTMVSIKSTFATELQVELGTIFLKHHFYLSDSNFLRVRYLADFFSDIKEVSLSRKTIDSNVVSDKIQTLK